jgi:uncharacterized protein (TIGR00290 family)
MPEPVIISWSGGKDSALALAETLRDDSLTVIGLLTTVTRDYDRISMHGVRRTLLEAQAGALGLPLTEAVIGAGASNTEYEAAFAAALSEYRAAGVRRVVFGDLFLADIRAYRERQLAALGMQCLFPVWGRDTTRLAGEFVAAGFRAIVCCVDPRQINPSFCGREFDTGLLEDLPEGVDPCGENGEFHTFVDDGPIFDQPVACRRGEVVSRDGFWYCDLVPGRWSIVSAPFAGQGTGRDWSRSTHND